jgi:hypothetical protein
MRLWWEATEQFQFGSSRRMTMQSELSSRLAVQFYQWQIHHQAMSSKRNRAKTVWITSARGTQCDSTIVFIHKIEKCIDTYDALHCQRRAHSTVTFSAAISPSWRLHRSEHDVTLMCSNEYDFAWETCKVVARGSSKRSNFAFILLSCAQASILSVHYASAAAIHLFWLIKGNKNRKREAKINYSYGALVCITKCKEA